jgi:hypothetical protein
MGEELKVENQDSAETAQGQSEILQKCLQTYQKVITSHEQQATKIEQII